jgi:hypothetical protein
MRRAGWIVVAALTVAGCSKFRDMFTSHADTAARVGDKELGSARVAEIINRLGGPTANPEAANLVAGIWVDLTLFAERVARGDLTPDSTLMTKLLWPQLTESKIQAWHDTLIARRPAVTDAQVDSAFGAGTGRIFQHILWMAAGPNPADTAAAKVKADRIAPQTRTGDFGKLAELHSSDGSKSDQGFLPPGPRGIYVGEFEQAAWSLGPGEVSPVVKTQFGFHIIRRPTLEEARTRYAPWVTQQITARADSIYMASLESTLEIKVRPGAAAAVRTAAADPSAMRTSGKELVSYKGGSFKVRDLVPWIEAMPVQSAGQIKMASDTILEGFVKSLAQNVVLARQADSANVGVNPAILAQMSGQFRAAIEALREAIGLNTPEFSDTSKTPEPERLKLASTRVEEFFDKLTRGEAQFRQIPPTLSSELRKEGDYRIYAQGIAKAKELISAQRVKDSTAAAAAAGQPPGLQAAPGGPPVGGTPDTTKRP